MIPRKLDKKIVEHYASNRSALLLTGARQTGKTYAIRKFAEENGYDLLEINFFSDPAANAIFENHAGVDDILIRISAYSGKPMRPGKTLVFFDEVQKCPEVITMIKFLVEDGRFRYALSGSLLGVELKNIRSVPVGYLSVMEVFPLDFEEFVRAVGAGESVLETIKSSYEHFQPVDSVVHQSLLRLLNLYLVMGGMPAAVQIYLDTHDVGFVQAKQKEILEMYKLDISQYDPGGKLYVNEIFDLIPSELNAKNKRFILKKLNEGSRFSKYENGFLWLSGAGAAIPVYNITMPAFPLKLNEQRNLFKLFQNDVGLLSCQYAGGGYALKVLSGETTMNHGAVYENFVAQELLCHGLRPYYFNSKKQGELDFVIEDSTSGVIPIEVKSGKDYERHNAITAVLSNEEYAIGKAIVLCNDNVKLTEKTIYLPIYMTMFMHKQTDEGIPLIVKPDLTGLV